MEKTDQYYQVLGLKPGASKGEIVQAYKTLMKTWYPQRNNEDQALREIAKEKLREIEEAYVRLSTPGSPPQRQGEGASSGSKLASGSGQPGEKVPIRENATAEPFRSHGTTATPPKKATRPSNSWFASEKMSVPLLVILVVVTLGFYYPIWFLQRRNKLNRLRSTEKIGSGVFIFAIVTLAIGCLIPWLSSVENIEKIFILIAGIPLLIQCFKVRRILHEHFTPNSEVETVSAVATFFFQIYYLQYKINRFIDEGQVSEYLIKTHAAEETSSPRSVRVLDTSGTSGDQEKSAFIPVLGAIVGIAILIFIVASALRKGDAPVKKGNDVRQETKSSSLPKANRSSSDSSSDESLTDRLNRRTKGDWRFLSKSPTGKEESYDANSLMRDPNSNRVRVWIRSFLLPEEREKFPEPSPSKFVALKEYDCTERKLRTLTMIFYGDDETILGKTNERHDWVHVPPGSNGDIEIEFFCR